MKQDTARGWDTGGRVQPLQLNREPGPQAKETKTEGQQKGIFLGRDITCQVLSTKLIPNTMYW